MIEKPSGNKKIEKADKKQKKSPAKKNIKIKGKSEEETILKNVFFESSVTANYTTDINCIVNYINPEFLNIWGYSNKEEVIGKPLSVFFRNDVTMNLIIRTLNEIGKWKGGYIGIKKDGSSFISECSASSIYNEKGEHTGYQFTNIDITTHKKIDDDTHKSEEQIRRLFEDSPLGMAFANESFIFTKVNPAMCEMTGYTEKELLKMSFKDLTHPDFIKENKFGLTKLFKGEISVYKTEKIYVKKNREYFWGNLTVTQVLNKVGDFLHYLAMVENISERKFAEIALQTSEKKYRKLYDSIRDGFVVVDMSGQLIEYNETFMRMLGYDRDELSLLNYTDITPEKWHSYEKKIVDEQILPRGYSDVYEKEYIRKDGTIFPIELQTFLMKNEAGKNEAMGAIIRDITERRKQEQFIKNVSLEWQNTFDSVQDVIWHLDKEQRITRCNKATEKILGKKNEDVLGHYCWEVAHDATEPINHCPYNKMHKSKQREILEFNKDNKWFVATVDPLLDHNGNINGAVHIISDITVRKLAEEEIKREKNKAQNYLDIAEVIFLVLDENMKVTLINKKGCEILGYSENEIKGKNWFDNFIPVWDRNRIRASFKKIMSGEIEKFENSENNILTKSGEERIISWHNTILKDDTGKIIGTLSSGFDVSEQKRAEAELTVTRHYLENYFNIASASIIVWNQDLKITRVNSAFEHITGFKDSEVIGKELGFLFPEKTKNKSIEEITGKSDTAKWESTEIPLRCKNGDEKILLWNSVNVFDDKGNNLIATIAQGQDITERKKMEEDLRISENRMKQLAENAGEWIWETDMNGLYTYSSSALENVLGYKPEEIVGKKHFYDLFDDKNREELKKIAFEAFRKQEKITNFENLNLHKNGNKVLLSTSGEPILDENNKAIKYRGVDRDITKSKAVQIELRKSEERYRTLIENQGEGIVLIDMNEVFVFANPAANEIFGVTGDTLAGKSLKDFISDEIFEFMKQDAEMKSGLKKRSYEIEITKPNGVKGNLLMTLTPRFNDIEELIGTFGIFRDITERKIYEKEILNAKKKAEESEQAKATFLANMSHELRTPMVGILGYSELLCETTKDQNIKEMAEAIMTSGMRLKDTLNLILDLSKLERGKVSVHYKNIDLIRSTKNVIDLYKASAQKKKLDLELITSFEVLNVILDDRLLFEILSNLINNAIKYTNAGRITVEVSNEKDEWIVIKVKDTGIGIPKEKQDIIFDEFRQASEGFSRTFEGTGLGLTITNNFIELMNGEIKVESELGKGSTFTVRLPKKDLVSDKESKPGMEVKTPAGENQREYSVLCVDNDTTNNLLVKLILGESYILDIAINDVTALDMVKKKKYDVILLDINLGEGINGLEVLKKIREIPEYKKTPVVALTAFAMVGDKEEFLSKGCDLYLSKPYTRNMLKSIVNEAVEKINY